MDDFERKAMRIAAWTPWVAFAAMAPATILAATLFPGSNVPGLVFVVLMFVVITSAAVFGLWPCPRCGKPFFNDYEARFRTIPNPTRSRCIHCDYSIRKQT